MKLPCRQLKVHTLLAENLREKTHAVQPWNSRFATTHRANEQLYSIILLLYYIQRCTKCLYLTSNKHIQYSVIHCVFPDTGTMSGTRPFTRILKSSRTNTEGDRTILPVNTKSLWPSSSSWLRWLSAAHTTEFIYLHSIDIIIAINVMSC